MTVKLFYEDAYLKEATAKVEAVEVNGERIRVKLDRTIFYPEGGGQPSDRGVIYGEGFRIEVEHVEGKEEIWHEGVLKGREPKEGEEVNLELDWEWRYENMRQHTGQHILSAILKRMYGSDTTGFQIFPDYNKIEINFDGELTWKHVLAAELEANEVVWSDVEVNVEEHEELPEDLVNILRKRVPDVKSRIRIVGIEDVDITPCGGTHVKRTSEIGFIKVLNFYKKSKNIWRIEFACGYRALIYLDKLLEDYWGALEEMPNKNRPLVERVREFKADYENLEEEKTKLRRELWEWKARALLNDAEEIGGIKVVSHLESAPMKGAQAFAVYLVDKNPNTIALIVGDNYALFAKNEEIEGISMRELLRSVLSEVGGGGGGSDILAKGGGFKVSKEEVLEKAKEILREMLTS
ncbi:alanyl-tRNA editing protein AlaX [Palaeococcus pacificus DY20341]|uniref:Alanyl-tRNA editing protein AlaX n=1 Tax=Palaeococcus pacificus DY20341 TaxID=1343739 RepID=A0A075M0V6_9EURY|nr:DHHA1 domain-containing protein [Palaeococcus pacificus]AIF70418.1 alanyl-tRNA editing protein AlaX [Palaeococcus pacificus DY20341]